MQSLRPARHRPIARLAVLTSASVLLVAACGDDDDDATPAAATGAPAATEAPAATTAAPDTAAPTTAGDRGGYGAVDTEPTAATGGDDAAGGGVLLGDTDLGQVLTGPDAMTVYLFLPDNAGAPTCAGGCAEVWPPLLVDDGATPTAGDGVDAALLGTAEHPDGGTMVTYNGWPLYYYEPDEAPGDTTGQGSGGVWYVIGPDGEPIE